MPGALLQLAAYGPQNIYLTGNPQITFFVMVYKRHTNFAIETNQQLFTGDIGFGKKFFCKIQRIGDLISEMYFEFDLPSLYQPDECVTKGENGLYRSWINSIGHALILNYYIEICGEIINRQYGQWLEIWSELTMTSEKINAYNNMIGKHENFNPTIQGEAMTVRVPLQFWFNRHKGLALPLIALQNSEVNIYIETRPLNQLWVSTLEGDKLTRPDKMLIERASLYVDYIFLEDEERRFFAKNEHYYLIERLQMHSESLRSEKSDNIVNLDQFNHPTKEIIWVVQNEIENNEWFNFSDRPFDSNSGPGGGTNATDNVRSVVLQINGDDRFTRRSGEYFRVIEPYKYHTRAPNNFIYLYSFGFCPEEHQPSGICNLSRIDNFTMNIDIIPGLTNPVIYVYSRNYNILEISGGLAGIKYNN